MGKILQLKWYSWVLLSLQFLSNFLASCKVLYSLPFIDGYESPFIPSYASYLFYLDAFITFIPAIFCCLGIILLVYKKRLGWVLTASVVLWHTFTLLMQLFQYEVNYILLFVVLPIQVLTLFILFVPKNRTVINIKYPDYIFVGLIAIILILVNNYTFPISIALQNCFG